MTAALAVGVVRRAAREIAEAAEWWHENRPDAADAVREEVERAFELIASHPEVGARAVSASLRGVRRVHLARIRYHLYYRVTPDAVQVLAFWHSRRGQSPDL